MTASLRQVNLERLIRPRSVAIIGASADPARIGGRPVRYLLEGGFQGRIYPVNPKREEVQGLRSYASISDIGEPVDAAIVAVPAEAAVEATGRCAAAGVGGVVLFSSDFAEAGEDGMLRQAQLARIAAETGMRILGPNCLGLFDAASAAFLTFSSFFDRGIPKGGRAALISQSGGFGSHLLEVIKDRGVSVGTWITTGNEADVELGECLEWAAAQQDIETVLAYAEGVRDGVSFRRGLERLRDAGKPLVFMKAGRSERGVAAATTHTAALAGADAMYQGIFEQFGVKRVYTAEQLADVAYLLDRGALPRDKQAALFTVSGASGVQMADSASDCGLDVPLMPENVCHRIKQIAPFASPANPIDFTAQALNNPDIVLECLSAVAEQTDIGSFVIYLTMTADDPGLRQRLLDSLSGFAASQPQRLFLVCMLARPELVSAYEEAGFFVFEDSARAIGALGTALRDPAPAPAPVEPSDTISDRDLQDASKSEVAGKALLSRLGLRVPRGRVIHDPASARDVAGELGTPLVAKIVSETILHKSDVGGVRTGIRTAGEAEVAAAGILASVKAAVPDADDCLLLLEEQVEAEAELILGVECDPVLGPMVMVGFGGINAEIYRDVAFRMAPVAEDEAVRMLESLRARDLFGAFRGRGPVDLLAAARAISKLSRFASAHGDRLASIDINPLMLETAEKGQGNGAIAADCLIVLRTPQ